MPLPDDYDNPGGQAEAEATIRESIKGIFLSVAGPYGFNTSLAHVCPRYTETDEEWEAVATIEDPDTMDAGDDAKRRLLRYFAIAWAGQNRVLAELTFRYDLQITLGFKDEYATGTPGRRSWNELVALVQQFDKRLADNQELGLDDRVSHTFLQCPLRPIWDADDPQSVSAVTVNATLAVILKACQFG